MARYLYSELASAIQARINCGERIYNPISGKYSIVKRADKNPEWFDKWTERIAELSTLLPHGSGINCGTKIDLDKSHAGKIIMYAGFHHMNESGMYDGWTYHTVTVTPSFTSHVNLRISGRDRNQIKEYLYETFYCALEQEVPALVA